MHCILKLNSELLADLLARFCGCGGSLEDRWRFCNNLAILCFEVYVETHDLWQETVYVVSFLMQASRSVGNESCRCLLALMIELILSCPALDSV